MAKTITLHGVVARVDGRLVSREPYGTHRVFYQSVRPPMVTLALENGDSIDVPWSGDVPALRSRWSLVIEEVME